MEDRQDTQKVREMIGRGAPRIVPRTASYHTSSSYDATRPDYVFWDRLRRGKKQDYLMGGLFADPITRQLASWVFGKGIVADVEADDNTAAALNDFFSDNIQTLIAAYKDSLGLGDAYLHIDITGDLTRISPDQVEAMVSPAGSLNVIGYRVTTQLDEALIKDEYASGMRTIITKRKVGETTEVYPLPGGVIPIIHIASGRGANELYGHPYVEALLRLMQRYDKVINKSLDGVEVMGNPLPTIEGVDDPQGQLDLMATATETYIDADGTQKTREVIDFSTLPFVIVGKGGSFSFTSPGTFTGDAEKMLGILFLLMLQHSGVPEWAWGGAIASSKASVDAQMPAFELLIELLRLELTPIFLTMCEKFLTMYSFVVPGLNPEAEIRLNYPPVRADDRAIRLQEVKFGRDESLLTRETALGQLNLVDDPSAEIAARDAEDAGMVDPIDAALANALKNDQMMDNHPANEAEGEA